MPTAAAQNRAAEKCEAWRKSGARPRSEKNQPQSVEIGEQQLVDDV